MNKEMTFVTYIFKFGAYSTVFNNTSSIVNFNFMEFHQPPSPPKHQGLTLSLQHLQFDSFCLCVGGGVGVGVEVCGGV